MVNEDIKRILKKQKEYFDNGNTLSIQTRINWLKKLKESIIANEDELSNALQNDLGRQKNVSFVFEFKLVYDELDQFIKHLNKWSKDTSIRSTLILFNKKSKITHLPHGQVYLIVPFNFPVLLGLQPLVGSIGCGNVTFYKPSKLTPNTNSVIKKILSIFPQELVYFLDSSLSSDELNDLNSYSWDFIFFTGSNSTAEKIYYHQYSNFLPAVFELGGKSPMIIDETANLRLAALKFLTTKLINSGQICIGVDYLILKNNIVNDFIKEVKELYFNSLKPDPYFVGNLITKKKADEVNFWLENEDSSKFIIKDFHKPKGYLELKFALISYDDVKNKEYLNSELFSPLSYYRTYENNDDILNIIKEHNNPLTIYCFSKNKVFINFVKQRTYSGSFIVNDTLSHMYNYNLPFGGIKKSGIGKYHGKWSFETFSVNKPYLISKKIANSSFFDIRNAFKDDTFINKIIKKR